MQLNNSLKTDVQMRRLALVLQGLGKGFLEGTSDFESGPKSIILLKADPNSEPLLPPWPALLPRSQIEHQPLNQSLTVWKLYE